VTDTGAVGLLKHADGSVWIAYPEVEGPAAGPHRIADVGANIRAAGARVCWRSGTRIVGYDTLEERLTDLTVDPVQEFWPVPFRVGEEYWVLSHTHTRLLLRPWGSHAGYVVADGIATMYPDAAYDGTHLRVAWSSPQGGPAEWRERPDAPRVDLRPSKPSPSSSRSSSVSPSTSPSPSPSPESDPMPEPTITDPEFVNAGGRIEWHYASRPERYPITRTVRTDHLSYRWMVDYYTLRKTMSHEPAIREVERRMAVIADGEPMPSPPPGGLVGAVVLAERAFLDDTGPRLPVLCHAGDLLSRWQRGQHTAVGEILDTIRSAGYHGVRTWSFLTGSYWTGRQVEITYDGLMGYCAALRARELKLLLSQGDLWQSQVSTTVRHRVRQIILDTLAEGGVRDVLCGLDAANEPVNNGGATPQQLTDWLRPIAERAPDLPISTGAVGEIIGDRPGDYAQRRKDYAVSPARMHEHHISGSVEQLIGRHWTEGYESPTWLHRASEPRGPGQRVSGTRVTDPYVLQLMAVASVMSGGEYTYFCGPGVISDEGESFAAMPGFREVPPLIASLPQDLHLWPTRCHGGARFAGTRIYAVPEGEDTRAEHTIADNGRFVCLLHRGHWERCYAERVHRVYRQVDFGAAGRLILGTC
jgi:hypothetical protein